MNNARSPRRSRFGPGLLVTAAFIGPGTITTASSAGAHFGFALLWALLFSVAATLVLQEMSARLGLVTREGLAEAMRAHFRSPLFGKVAVLLIVAAVGFGNAPWPSTTCSIPGTGSGPSSSAQVPPCCSPAAATGCWRAH